MSRWALALLLSTTAACSGGANSVGKGPRLFAPDWQNDGGRSISEVQVRVQRSPLPAGTPVAVGVTERGLVGIRLDGGSKWSYPTMLDARPIVTGEVVVGSGGGRLFALEAASGRPLWSVPVEGALRGAGDDGKITVATLANPAGGPSSIVAVSRDGNKLLDNQPGVEVGNPAVRGGIAFVPWGSQYVSALEVASGKEVGRWLSQAMVSHALNIGGEIYFGQRSLTRLDEKIGDARPPSVALPNRELPGKPVWFDDATDPSPPKANARDRIRAYARPTATAPIALENSRFVATYFRIAMGLSAEEAKLDWVASFSHDVLGGAAASGGFALCDASGKVTLLDESGGVAGGVSLGQAVSACVVQTATLQVTKGKAPPALAEQISRAIQVGDAQMVPAQRFLLAELARIEAPVATKALIDVAENTRTPPELLADARDLLSKRRTGAEHMLEALKRHYDFLGDVLRPPPVGPLADALAAMNESRAAPLLAEHLNDPANSVDDVERAARALAKLATAEQADELKTFFALYRATADQRELVNAVVHVAEALLRIAGEEGRRIVERAAEDPLTHPQVKAGLAGLVATKRSG